VTPLPTAAQTAGEIEASVNQALADGRSELKVIVILRTKSLSWEDLKQSLREHERGLAERMRVTESPEEVEELAKQAKQARRDLIGEYYQRITEELRPSQDYVAEEIERNGGKVGSRYTMFNGMSATLPVATVLDLSRHPEVETIFEDRPQKGLLNNSVPSMGTQSFWNAGYLGGSYDVGILDTGVDTTHPAFAGKNFISRVFLNNGRSDPCFNDDITTVDDKVGHGTHVTGIVMSQGSSGYESYRGVARGLDKTLALKVGFKCTEWWFFDSGKSYPGDVIDAINWAFMSASDYADVLNYSFGDAATADDDTFCQRIDDAVDSFGKLITVSAGNTDLSPNVTSPGIAYNILSIVNVDDHNNTSRGDDTISSTSSRGPTRGGRKKPDLAAPGTAIKSTNDDWEDLLTYDFVEMSGTSMAAPHVAGAVALMLNAKVPYAEAIKAVLINTAEDKGAVEWDPEWGWGYVDLSRAYTNRGNYKVGQVQPSPQPGHAEFYKGSTVGNPGKATLVWSRHAGSSFACPYGPNILNDLDLYAYGESSGARLDRSYSSVDNVEQVQVPGVSSVVLKVDAFCTDLGEFYALATESGFNPAGGPDFNVSIPNKTLNPGQQFTVTVTVTNTGDLKAHSSTLTLNVPSGFSIVTGSNPRSIGAISAGAAVSYTWTIAAPSRADSYAASATVDSSSYEEDFSGTGNATWEVVDNVLPTITISGGPSGTVNSQDATFTWSGSDDTTPAGSLVYAYRLAALEPNYSDWTSDTRKFYGGLSNGPYTFYVKPRDEAGNEGSAANRTFTVSVPITSESPSNLSFGNQLLNTTSSALPVTVTNTGTATLTINSVSLVGTHPGDFEKASDGCSGANVAPNNNCVISVTFRPTVEGPRSATLSISDNASGSPHTVPLSGTGTAPAPQVSLSPPNLSFGDQVVSTTSSAQPLTVTNTGTATLTISSVSVVGANPGDFAKASDGCSGVNVAPNNNCVISVTFRPTVEGPRSATLSISNNASGSPHTLPLSGTGTASAPEVCLSPINLPFDNQVVNTTSAARSVTLTNCGTAPLTINSVSLVGTNPGDFAKASDTCSGANVAPGNNCVINVTFRPTATGLRNATLRISDDASGSPHTVALSGTGMDFTLAADPTSKEITAGQSATYTLSVTPVSGFNQAVSLTCSANPSLSQGTCTISPNSVTPDGTNAPTATVNVTTTGCSLAAPVPGREPRITWRAPSRYLPLLGLLLTMLLAMVLPARRRAQGALALGMLWVLVWAACGGGGGAPPPPPPCFPTPSGTYTLTVSGTSGGLSKTTTLTLKVN
jgi:subtilisin family serine protease